MEMQETCKMEMQETCRTQITITNQENQLFNLLLDCASKRKKNTIIRVAGGWVRDKIIGLPNDDIDIALDNISGVEFANDMNIYLTQNGIEVHTVAVIQANPEQSKHLETANIRILGFDIDCVNLREETYSDSSRIPDIKFGTPIEDAMRRDFTINSLFYNLNTKAIEDFTGHGLLDIDSRVIRTPLPATITFLDDPLRILRAIRFACRYDFYLDPTIIEAAILPAIHNALKSKVSRERILIELEGMLGGRNAHPIAALKYIYQLQLWDCVFPLPTLDLIKLPVTIPETTTTTTTTTAIPSTTIVVSHDMVSTTTTIATAAIEDMRIPTIPNIMNSNNISNHSNDDDDDNSSITNAPSELSKIWQGISLKTMLLLNFLINVFNLEGSNKLVDGSPIAFDYYKAIEDHISTAILRGMNWDLDPKCSEISCILLDYHRTRWTRTLLCDRVDVTLTPLRNIRLMFYAAIMSFKYIRTTLKFDELGIKDYLFADKKKDIPLYQMIMRDLMKIDNETMKAVNILLGSHSQFYQFAIVSDNCSRADCGMLIRQCGPLWKQAWMLSCAISMSNCYSRDFSPSENNHKNSSSFSRKRVELEFSEKRQEIINRYYNLLHFQIEARKLGDAWKLKPLFDGNILSKELGIKKGPQIGQIIEKQIRWQLEYPSGTSEQCLQYLRDSQGSF